MFVRVLTLVWNCCSEVMCLAGESWSRRSLRKVLKSSKLMALKLGKGLGRERSTGMSIIVTIGRWSVWVGQMVG